MAVADKPTVRRPRNAAATRKRLLAAAQEEFAEYGFAGARIDRIAEQAQANKGLIYVYYGSKVRLFQAVIDQLIDDLAEVLPVSGDLVVDAAARFDYLLANPQVRRLSGWRAFEHIEASPAERARYRSRIDAVAAEQRSGRVTQTIAAEDLVAMMLSLSESWLNAMPALHDAAGGDPLDKQRLAAHRASLLEAVRRLTTP